MAAKPPVKLTDPPARTKFLDKDDKLISWPWLKWLGELTQRLNNGRFNEQSPIGPAGPTGPAGTGGSPSVNDFRLTLAPGFPVYSPQPATPSSTDTAADTVTFSTAPGWVTGTIVTVSATNADLTATGHFYLRAVSATLFSFHNTAADAFAGTNKINLTVSLTAQVIPSGITNSTLYLSPYIGSSIGLYSGGWATVTSAEISLALGTLTSGKNYDVFAYNNGGALAMELLVWTDDLTRATALSRQDGIRVKSTDATRRYVGTIRTDSTTTTIDDGGGISSNIGGQRFVYNAANRVRRSMQVWDGNVSWSYSTATWRVANAQNNKVFWVDGLGESGLDALLHVSLNINNSSAGGFVAIGLDQTTDGTASGSTLTECVPTLTSGVFPLMSELKRAVSAGYHYAAWLEAGSGSITTAWFGRQLTNPWRFSQLQAEVWM